VREAIEDCHSHSHHRRGDPWGRYDDRLLQPFRLDRTTNTATSVSRAAESDPSLAWTRAIPGIPRLERRPIRLGGKN
jgi:hypothetical protein